MNNADVAHMAEFIAKGSGYYRVPILPRCYDFIQKPLQHYIGLRAVYC